MGPVFFRQVLLSAPRLPSDLPVRGVFASCPGLDCSRSGRHAHHILTRPPISSLIDRTFNQPKTNRPRNQG